MTIGEFAMISRRKLLSTAAVSAAAGGIAATPARAFQIEAAREPVLEAYYSVCRPTGFHEELLAQVEAALNGKELSEELAARIDAAARDNPCPICGCPIGQAQDHEGASDAPGADAS